MVRITDKHPFEMPYWWTHDEEYVKCYGVTTKLQVNPSQVLCSNKAQCEAAGWIPCNCQIDPASKTDGLKDPCAWRSPQPFGNGHMRLAWYLWSIHGMFVVKRYNADCESFIAGLGITEKEAIQRDMNTYVLAGLLAMRWNSLPEIKAVPSWRINFVKSFRVCLDKEVYFGETFVELNNFLKWNTNTGENNESAHAKAQHCDLVAACFSHFTWSHTDGHLMVVDLQGWDNGNQGLLFTDPQIHVGKSTSSTSWSRLDGSMVSIGNLGKTGICRFFVNHTCSETCHNLKLRRPLRKGKDSDTCNNSDKVDDETMSVASLNSSNSKLSKLSFFKKLVGRK
jgi:hypothetical protein